MHSLRLLQINEWGLLIISISLSLFFSRTLLTFSQLSLEQYLGNKPIMRRSILARGPLSWICSWPRSSSAMRASSVSAMLHTIPVTRQSSFNDPDDWKGCLSWRMLTNTSTCDTTKCKTCREINSLILHQEMKRQTTSTTSSTLRGKKWKTIFYASCCNFDEK